MQRTRSSKSVKEKDLRRGNLAFSFFLFFSSFEEERGECERDCINQGLRKTLNAFYSTKDVCFKLIRAGKKCS